MNCCLHHRRQFTRPTFLLRLIVRAGALLLFGTLPSLAARSVDLATDQDAVRIEPVDFRDQADIVASCDVNGDRIDDLLIGALAASGVNNQRPAAGEVFVISGRRGAWRRPLSLSSPDVRIIGPSLFSQLGAGLECGDVNGDGYNDIVAGANTEHDPSGLRPGAGAVHLIFGGPEMPSLIDLADAGGVTIRGPEPYWYVGELPAVGDINGDGIDDILVDAPAAANRSGETTEAGRVYVVFGRTEWPSAIDLASEADLVIFGRGGEERWRLGAALTASDMDGDGTAEILASVGNGDGPRLGRQDAGQVLVFRGRRTWPDVIDLEHDHADSVIYGAESAHQFGYFQTEAIDLDGNGFRELAGSANTGLSAAGAVNAGQIRTVELGPYLPPSIDLKYSSDLTVFGADEDDDTGGLNASGDVNGDGTTDLMFAALYASGPDETRRQAGEISVLFGRLIWPHEFDLAKQRPDLLVYGAHVRDWFFLGGSGDINGDGLDEIVGITEVIDNDRLETLYMLSPFDIDGDGISQLPDNCARLCNPDQKDSDGDLVGDLCDNCPLTWNQDQNDQDSDSFGDACDSCPGRAGADASDIDGDGIDGCHDNCPAIPNADQTDREGDGVGDACDACPTAWAGDFDSDGLCAAQDNCPQVFNRRQIDSDHDGVGDVCDSCADNSSADSDHDGQPDSCDCRPLDAATRQPDAVRNLILRRPPSGITQLRWTAPTGADSYSVRRGELGEGQAGVGSGCVVKELVEPSWDDSETPSPGAGFSYLVQAHSATCGAGLLGSDSEERPRDAAQFGCDALVYHDRYAITEVTLWGTVQGNANDTKYRDGRSEVLTEQLTPGEPPFFQLNRFSVLEHQWRFDVVPGEAIEFHLTASRTASPDGDDFQFEYSADSGASWIALNLGRLPYGTEPRLPRAIPLPGDLVGALLLRVVDTDHTPASQPLDSLTIDEMFVRTVRPTLAP